MRTKAIVVLMIVAAVCFAGGAAATDLEITPVEDFEPSGEPGGPFTPSYKEYQLTNIGPNSLYWGAAKTVDWLALEPDWGLLGPSELNIVTVSLTSEANLLGAGVHTDTLTFTDITNGEEQTRGATLTVGAPAVGLYITPVEDFEPSGEPGGPFTPSYKEYQLTNIGPNSLYWGTAKTVDWLALEPDWGLLGPSESNIVTVSLTSEANLLGAGVHTDTLTFTDITNGEEQTRGVTLTITVPGGIWVSPTSFDVNIIEGCRLTETLTIGNNGPIDLDFMIRTRVVGDSGQSVGERVSKTATRKAGIFSIPIGHDFTVVGDAAYEPGELIVRFAAKADGKQRSKQEKNQILSSLGGGTIKRSYKIVPGLSVVKLPAGMTVEDALKTFNKANGILYAEPNYEVKAIATFPNDTRFDDLWGMHNTGQTGGTVDADIDAPEAWDVATGSGEVIVAVIDTGVDYTHIDLAANMWVNEDEFYGTPGEDDDGNGYVDDIYGYDFRNNDGNPMDDHYHGTHCAGTVGAVGNNSEGVAGVCWNVRIMAVKFLSSGGSGTTEDAISSVEYSTLMGANLSSNSWGGGGYSQGLKDAIDAAGAAGMLFVASTGNDDENTDVHPHYPSSYDCESLISAMATDKNDNKSSFSNYGPISVDLGAPGSDILSCNLGGGYHYLSGTSMATPHVAGACALVWSMNPMLSNSEVKDILLQTVDSTLPGLCVSEGRLNLYGALLETRAPWIYIEPEEGTIGPGDSNDVSVTFDAITMTPGTYEAEIVIISNDPCNPIKVVPVTMTVNPDDLVVTPAEGFESSGTKGGPFEPECITYTLTNNGIAPVSWTTDETEDWLEVDPCDGVLDPCESIDVNVCISPDADLLEPNLYSEVLIFQNTDSNSIKPRSITLTIKPPDCFTESFDERDNDLALLSLTFSPDGSIAYYEACRERAREFPTDPNGGTYVSLGDDDFVEVILSYGAEVLFYGGWYDRFYIGSNGYITFEQGDTEYMDTLENHFNMLRVSALFTDLTPSDNISWKQLDDRVAVTFEDVWLFGDKDAKNSFQIEIFFVDGTICITWLDIAATSGVAGLSEGKGLPPVFFVESDLSGYTPCWPLGDLDRDYLVNFFDFAVLAMYWLDADCNIPYWCEKTDLDFSGATDVNDLGIFSENWLIIEDWWLWPISHWKFDEGEGDIAYDSAGNNHGTIYGAQWTTGQINSALSFDGVNDCVNVGKPKSLRNMGSATMALWFKPGFTIDDTLQRWLALLGRNVSGVGANGDTFIAFCPTSGYTGRLHLDIINETGAQFVVGSDSNYWPAGIWQHVGVTWDNATGEMRMFINGVEQADKIDNFTGLAMGADRDVTIGSNSEMTEYWWDGDIDEVAIWNRALSAEEIEEIFWEGLGGRAFNPNPADGAVNVDPNTMLSWSPGKDALSHDVYFGTDFSDVNDANTTDPNVYMGNQDANGWDPNNYDSNGLEYETTYYWRIDEIDASNTYKGDIWSFKTWTEVGPNLISWWKFDEGEGTIAYDSAGNNDGTLINGPTWTTGQIDGALDFDGDDDYVDVPDDPSLRFSQYDSFSISFWARPLNAGVAVCKMRAAKQWGFFGYWTGWTSGISTFYFFVEKSRIGRVEMFTSDDSAPPGSWYHVTCVYDNKDMKIYLNGQLHNSATFTYDTGSTTADKNLAIGARSYDAVTDGHFAGKIDDVRIYDRALSDEEIWQLYQEGLND